MSAHQSLMDELEEAVQSGSRDKRVDTLRRITDLFLVAPAQLTDQQVEVFDDVLTHLISRVETKARAELAERLAPIDQAPHEAIRRLAHDDQIAVAGPILTQSTRLTTSDLVEIAEQKGQAHLLAIASRETVEDKVTDVLVSRGDRSVVTTLASNVGASFSPTGYSALVKRADGDETLSEKLGRRLDMPLQLFRELLRRATEAVRQRLLAAADASQRDAIQKVLASISQDVEREAPRARDFESAVRLVSLLKETGRLNEGEIHTFAKHEKYEEAMAGLAAICSVPHDLVQRLAESGRTDALLVPCKAAGFGWLTVRALLELRARHNALATHDLEAAASEYGKLSQATAARVLRFWQVRQTTVQQAAE